MVTKTYKYIDFYKRRCEDKVKFMGRVNETLGQSFNEVLNFETKYNVLKCRKFLRVWYFE